MDGFTKHSPTAPADLFAVEADGLRWLAAATASGGPGIPDVLDVSEHHITVERIDTGPWTATVDERLGRELAAMHVTGAAGFGWHRDGYIGPLPMANDPAPDWPSFYWTRRVEPFLRLAADRDGVPGGATATFDRLACRLADVAGPPEPPARIHGDLWRGNALADQAGRPWLVDPAAHGGHRETDLAMMALFGGFGERSFAAYDEAWPLADGWRERVALHQLHPLLVHAVLFGGGYGSQALAAARRYT